LWIYTSTPSCLYGVVKQRKDFNFGRIINMKMVSNITDLLRMKRTFVSHLSSKKLYYTTGHNLDVRDRNWGGGGAQMEILYLYSSAHIIRFSISRRRRWAWHVAHRGEMIVLLKNLNGSLLGRPRGRCEDNIKMG
jgi:hypothetical protein